MKTYFADTNFYLRFLLQDNRVQADKVEAYLQRAEKMELEIVFLSAVILEMGFVLLTSYRFGRPMIADRLLTLVKTAYVEVEDRQVWLRALPIYAMSKIDLIDIFLFEKAKKESAEVLSFDKDFRKLRDRK